MSDTWLQLSLVALSTLFFSYQAFTTSRDRYETVAPAALGIIRRCTGLAVSLWSRMAASSSFNRLRTFFAACSNTLPFRCIAYVLKIGAAVILLSINLVAATLGPVATKFANMSLTVRLPQSLTENAVRSGLWRLASMMHYYYLPFLSNGPRNCIITMSRHIKLAADNAKKDDWKNKILQRYRNLNKRATPCKQEFPDDGAEVYLYSKSLDGVNSSSLSNPGVRSNLTSEQREQPGSEGAQWWFLEASQELIEKSQYRHWIINIPTRDLAIHLYREENSASSKIDIGPSDKIINSAAAMGVNLGGFQQQFLGLTYVSNDYLKQLVDIENKDKRRKTSGQAEYNLVDNNCQTSWTDGMLDLIICDCEDTPRSTIFGKWPLSLVQSKEIMDWETAPAKLLMSLFLALARCGYVSLPGGGPWRQPWYVKWIVFFVQEFEAALPLGEAIAATNSLYPDPQWFPNFGLFHFICGAFSRGSTTWGILFEFVDIAIGAGALLWAKQVRKRLQGQSPTRPTVCWPGLFFRIYEKSRREGEANRELKDDIAQFLSRE